MLSMYSLVYAEKFRNLRIENGFRPEQVAEFLDISLPEYLCMETGTVSWSTDQIDRLCSLYECTKKDLFDECKTFAFRGLNVESFSGEDMKTIAAIGRIANNLKEMDQIGEEYDEKYGCRFIRKTDRRNTQKMV